MEASAIPASVGLARSRITIGASLLRIRTDEQLVTLFREGNDEAFRVIHDRYRARMFAYARQMLGHSGQDPEDAVQEIFMRAYHGLRANHRQLALRAWLYRIAHNRCIDDLRRPQALAIGTPQATASGVQDPVVRVEQRDALRRLIADVQRLPDQQRSALLMRELSGMSYADVSGALGVSVAAVKSLLVRARVGLAQASTARNTACAEIRADLVLAHDRGVRSSGLARRHLRECQGCREFRTEVRGVRRQLAALSPTLGPLGVIAHLLGWGGGGTSAAAGSAAVAGGSAAAGGGGAAAAGSVAAAGGSAVAAGATSGLLASGAGHVVTLLAAAVVTAGGAVEIQSTLTASATHHAQRHHLIAPGPRAQAPALGSGGVAAAATGSSGPGVAASPEGSVGGPGRAAAGNATAAAAAAAAGTGAGARRLPITMILDPDMWSPNQPSLPGQAPTGSGTAAGTGNPVTTPGATTTTPGATGQTGAPTGTATTPTSPPSATGTGTNTGAGSSTGSGTGSPPTPPPATSSGSTANTGSSPATAGTTRTRSVGRSTSSASPGSVVSFIAKRHRPRHRFLRDRLLTP